MVYCILGIKNQTDVHYAMPVRNMLYDSMQYSNQVETARKSHKQAKKYGTHEEFLSGFHKDDYLLPVITLVIYFGADKWDAPRSIRKMMLVRDERILQYTPDYKINLIAPEELSDTELEKFQTELCELLKFIKYSKDKKRLEEVVAEDKVISKPVLTAVAPVTGETPADVTAAEPEGYTVATAWADSDGNTVTEFEDGKDYTLTATLTAEKGYKFTDESKPSTIKVGEEDLEVTAEVKDSGKTMTLTYTFKGAEIGGDSVLSKPEITVTAPVKDAEPKDAQTDGFGYAATSKWTNKDGNSVTKFEAGQNYTLTIALTAEEGNIFDETSIPEKIQVGEEEVAVNASDVVISGEGKIMTLTLVFSVPADEVQYAKLEGLTGKADSEELEHDGEGEDGAIDNALDGNIETFWHTNWSDDSKAKVTYSDGKLTGNNTYTITLAKASTVTSLTYMPRNHYDGSGNIANGAISECEVYVSTDHGKNWTGRKSRRRNRMELCERNRRWCRPELR